MGRQRLTVNLLEWVRKQKYRRRVVVSLPSCYLIAIVNCWLLAINIAASRTRLWRTLRTCRTRMLLRRLNGLVLHSYHDSRNLSRVGCVR